MADAARCSCKVNIATTLRTNVKLFKVELSCITSNTRITRSTFLSIIFLFTKKAGRSQKKAYYYFSKESIEYHMI